MVRKGSVAGARANNGATRQRGRGGPQLARRIRLTEAGAARPRELAHFRRTEGVEKVGGEPPRRYEKRLADTRKLVDDRDVAAPDGCVEFATASIRLRVVELIDISSHG